MSDIGKTIRSLLLLFLLLALTGLICKPLPLCADTTYEFYAKGKTEGPHQGASDFALRYHDGDSDNLFKLDELIPGTFTGVILFGNPYTAILGVPINGWFSPLTDGPPFWSVPEAWDFTNGFNRMTVHGVYWTYSQTTVVPIPSGMILLGTLLMLLSLARRQKRIGS